MVSLGWLGARRRCFVLASCSLVLLTRFCRPLFVGLPLAGRGRSERTSLNGHTSIYKKIHHYQWDKRVTVTDRRRSTLVDNPKVREGIMKRIEEGKPENHYPGFMKSSGASAERDKEKFENMFKGSDDKLMREAALQQVEDEKSKELGLPPLKDRTFLVTGSTSGIGIVTAERLLRKGCRVIMHGRREGRLKDVMKKFAHEIPGAFDNLDGYICQLHLLSETRDFAQMIKAQYPEIHGILHNAAGYDNRRIVAYKELTKEDHEIVMATNCYSPHLLTSILLDNVRASGAGRIIFSSSSSIAVAKKCRYLDDLTFETKWDPNHGYTLTKLVNALQAAELDARFGDAPRMTFHAIDPGNVDTYLSRKSAVWGMHARKYKTKRPLYGMSPHVRSATRSFEALTKPEYQEISGMQLVGSPPSVNNRKKRARLWKRLDEATGAVWPAVPALLSEA